MLEKNTDSFLCVPNSKLIRARSSEFFQKAPLSEELNSFKVQVFAFVHRRN